ncbi:DUF2931 family protein [Pseudomonas sp. PDM26]|uniref:DUF2931 family protein n=1 Tax=Pseudomonas sp. PDM26 TaxID=2854766 RepID=UPI001C461A06|nr:DUF2931 family protein [Pseudomonas sp. PDM26]MBV7550681.1 DUF2931 family protein [Pseudomonas sp. PDM26]
MKHMSLLIGLLLSLCACASEPQPPAQPNLPYDSWYVGLAAPRFMEVWVETVDVLDQRGPYLNGKGIYYRALKPEAQLYIDQHGIPYGTW